MATTTLDSTGTMRGTALESEGALLDLLAGLGLAVWTLAILWIAADLVVGTRRRRGRTRPSGSRSGGPR